MLSLAERVYRTIQRHSLLPPDARVIAATSGGPDSTALVLLLAELGPNAGFSIASLAHYNHRLRGSDADADEAACASLAARLGLPFDVGTGDVPGAARQWGTSLEDAARRLRYAFFEEVRQARGATHVAVGHTRDDQAETILVHLMQGAGAQGRAGMRPRRGTVIRPLLECRRHELIDWLASRGEPYREDATNRDTRFLRNRVRLELLPFLTERFSPGIVETLARGGELAAEEAALLDDLAADLTAAIVRVETDRTVLDRAGLEKAPRVLALRALHEALRRFAPARGVGLDHAKRLWDAACRPEEGAGRRLRFPGQVAALTATEVILEPATGRGTRRREPDACTSDEAAKCGEGIRKANSFVQKLSIPGEAAVPGTRLVLSTEFRSDPPFGPDDMPRHPRTAVIDAAGAGALSVRFRRPGDCFRPLGLDGHKKLQDYFVDRKVPRGLRDRTPLVVTADDRIVWVAGHGIAEEFRVNDATRAVVILKLRGEIA